MNTDPIKMKRQHAAESYAALDARIEDLSKQISRLESERESAQRARQLQRTILGDSVGGNIQRRMFLIPGGLVVGVAYNVHGPQYAAVEVLGVEQIA